MKNKENAEELSDIMKKIGELSGIETVCIITNMNQPIGKTIGNSLELEEAINALNGIMKEDVKQIVLEISAFILKLAEKGENIEENKKKVIESIESRKSIPKIFRTH